MSKEETINNIKELQKQLISERRLEHPNFSANWQKEDDLLLLELYNNNKEVSQIAKDLGRTIGGIESRITKLRLDQFQFDFVGFVVDIAAEFNISESLFKSKVDLILDRRRYSFLKAALI